MDIINKTCRLCQRDLPATKLGRLSEKGFIYYASPEGKLWVGSMCPACSKEDRKKYNRKGHYPKKTCLQCNTEFQPERKTSKFCMESCGIKWHSLERTRKKHLVVNHEMVLPEGEQPIKLEIKLNKHMKKRKQRLEDIVTFKAEYDAMTEGLSLEQVKDALDKMREEIKAFDLSVDKAKE